MEIICASPVSTDDSSDLCLSCYCNFCLPYHIHEFHITSSPYKQGVGNKISLKIGDGWEPNVLPRTDNNLPLSHGNRVSARKLFNVDSFKIHML